MLGGIDIERSTTEAIVAAAQTAMRSRDKLESWGWFIDAVKAEVEKRVGHERMVEIMKGLE